MPLNRSATALAWSSVVAVKTTLPLWLFLPPGSLLVMVLLIESRSAGSAPVRTVAVESTDSTLISRPSLQVTLIMSEVVPATPSPTLAFSSRRFVSSWKRYSDPVLVLGSYASPSLASLRFMKVRAWSASAVSPREPSTCGTPLASM